MPVKQEIQMPPVPEHLRSDPQLYRWLQDLVRLFSAAGGIDGAQINLTSKSLTDLGTRNHADLQNILAVAGSTGASPDKHVSDDDWTAVLNAINDIATLQTNLVGVDARLTQAESDIVDLQNSQAAQDTTIADHEARLTAGGL